MERIHIALIALFVLSGSACLPYSSKFKCPKTDPGKCVSTEDAYNESLEVSKKKQPKSLQDELNDIERQSASGQAGSIAGAYRDALYAKLAGLLSEPATPMVAPPKVLRALIFPYRDDKNKLHMPRYVYYFVDDPKWILDENAASKQLE